MIDVVDVVPGSPAENTVVNSISTGGWYRFDTERSPDGNTIYAINGGLNTGTLIAVDVATESWTPVTTGVPGEFLEISPNGTTAYLSDWNSAIWVVDIASGVVNPIALPSPGNPYDMAMSHDGNTLYVASDNHGEIWLFDTVLEQFTSSVPTFYNRARQLGMHSDGSKLYIAAFAHGGPSDIEVLDTASNQMLSQFGTFASPQSISMFRGLGAMPLSN
jgi:DNA-binding beta-propeller fold protein YncE